VTECLLDAVFLFFERLLDPLVLEQLAAGREQVAGEQEDCLGGGADLRALVVGESFRPFL
jgi:hypothetical protein